MVRSTNEMKKETDMARCRITSGGSHSSVHQYTTNRYVHSQVVSKGFLADRKCTMWLKLG